MKSFNCLRIIVPSVNHFNKCKFIPCFCADNRQKGRFAGFSLYISFSDVTTPADIQSSTLCYKDGPQLPPLNFSTICTEFGRYVIFYNERLNGVKYPNTYEVSNVVTELCEVTVQGTYI